MPYQALWDKRNALVVTPDGQEQMYERDARHDCLRDSQGHRYRLDGAMPVRIQGDALPPVHWVYQKVGVIVENAEMSMDPEASETFDA